MNGFWCGGCPSKEYEPWWWNSPCLVLPVWLRASPVLYLWNVQSITTSEGTKLYVSRPDHSKFSINWELSDDHVISFQMLDTCSPWSCKTFIVYILTSLQTSEQQLCCTESMATPFHKGRFRITKWKAEGKVSHRLPRQAVFSERGRQGNTWVIGSTPGRNPGFI